MKFLFSKKRLPLLIALIVAILVVGGTIYSQKPKKSPQANTNDSIVAIREAIKTTSGVDTDGDGLKDWEESLWGTDPNNPDTDGDGTPDGEEASQGRNPTKPGPDDNLEEGDVKSLGDGDTQTELSETDKLSRKLFAQYIKQKQTGQEINEETQLKIIESVISDPSLKTVIDKYTEADIQTTADTSNVSTKRYGNAVGRVMKTAPQTSGEPDLAIFERSYRNANKQELAKLEATTASYKYLVEELLKVTVPKDATEAHLALVNSTNTILKSLEDMQTLFEDPIRAMRGFVQYTETLDQWQASFLKMSAYFSNKGISFQQSEDGYVLGSII